MSIGAALLEDICAHPADDGLRLIYADWLDDNGDPERAQYIRQQVSGESVEWDTWYNQEREWKNAMPTIPGIEWVGFQRGFVETINVNDVAAFEQAAPLIRRTIPLRGVHLSAVSPGVLARPCFAGLDFLSLYGKCITDDNAAQFADAENLRTLTGLYLNLSPSSLTTAGLRVLFGGPNLRGLRSLNLTGPDGRRFGAEAVQILADSVLAQLTGDLCLYGWDLAGPAAAPIAVARHLASLRLVSTNMGDAGIEALCSAGMPAGLDWLLLSSNVIGPAGAAQLADCGSLAPVDCLVLHDNPLSPEGVIALAERASFRPRSLFMSNTRGGDGGILALAASPLLGGIEHLQYGSNGVTLAGAAALTTSPHVGRLHTLDLRGNRLGDEGERLLSSAPALAGMKELSIWG
jgi:uncharacterized protein (TIGR02996 family)